MYDSRRMRRFWLLFLLVVLPVQMSWAAVHACEDGTALAGNVLAALEAKAEAPVAPALDDVPMEESKQGAPSVHACDGFHELMADQVQAAVEPASASFRVVSDTVMRLNAIAARVDRPQWRAA